MNIEKNERKDEKYTIFYKKQIYRKMKRSGYRHVGKFSDHLKNFKGQHVYMLISLFSCIHTSTIQIRSRRIVSKCKENGVFHIELI